MTKATATERQYAHFRLIMYFQLSMNLKNHERKPMKTPAIIPAMFSTNTEAIDHAKLDSDYIMPLDFEIMSIATFLHMPNKIRHRMLSNVHDAMSVPAIPLERP